MKLLAVDDDPMILELLLETLPRLGFGDVTGAQSAAEAMQLIATSTTPFDGFLFDIQMPEMTGIELCTWLRGQAGYAQVPVLMITAMSERSFINQSFEAGATDYVTKPFNPTELSARLEQAARLHQERRAPEPSLSTPVNTTSPIAEIATFVHVPQFTFETAFNIAEVRGVLDLLALENYLLQLGRGGMMVSACFAFRLQNAEALFQSCSAEEYYYTMADIAEVLSDSLRCHGSFVAHAGNGGFVCLSHGRDLPDPQELQVHVRNQIEELDLQYDDGRPMRVTLEMSPLIHLGLRSGPAALEQLHSALSMTALPRSEPHSAIVAPTKTGRSVLATKYDLRQRWTAILNRMRARITS